MLLGAVVKQVYGIYDKGSLKDARGVLRDSKASAVALLLAAKTVLPHDFLTWEPETVWAELDVPVENRDKLMAAMALVKNPSFFWDARVYGCTALAFNNETVFGENMPHTTPEQLAWATLEAEILFAITEEGDFEPHYSDDVAAYTAAMLYDVGWVACPPQLAFASEHLKRMYPAEVRELEAKIEDAQQAHPKGVSDNVEDGALGVQLAHQATCSAYVEHCLEQLKTVLTTS
jgi:hypothetical protein